MRKLKMKAIKIDISNNHKIYAINGDIFGVSMDSKDELRLSVFNTHKDKNKCSIKDLSYICYVLNQTVDEDHERVEKIREELLILCDFMKKIGYETIDISEDKTHVPKKGKTYFNGNKWVMFNGKEWVENE